MKIDLGKIKRGINHYHTKINAFIRVKAHMAYNTRVKYMLFKTRKSDVLIVSFPACAKEPKYNYMRTLLPFKCNKLFLLDDFGSNHLGCYLVENSVEKCSTDLLKSCIAKCKTKKVFFIGSSRGGGIVH